MKKYKNKENAKNVVCFVNILICVYQNWNKDKVIIYKKKDFAIVMKNPI